MGYLRLIVTPAAKTTLHQPGLQRRWTALDGEDVSDGGDPNTGYDCPLPLVDDLRDGFACNEPLIAAKQCFGRTQRSLWLKDTGSELEPVVDVAWGYDQASLRTWRRDTTPGASEEHQDQLGYDQWRCIGESLGTSTDPDRQYIWNPQDRWDLILIFGSFSQSVSGTTVVCCEPQ